MRKFAFIIIPAFLMLVVALVVTVFLINTHDQAPLPEVTAALAPRPDTSAARDNLFFAVLAFDVRDSSDLNADGQQIYANYLSVLQDHALRAQYAGEGSAVSAPEVRRRP